MYALSLMPDDVNKFGSRSRLVIIAAQRAQQLMKGIPSTIVTKHTKPTTIALEEVLNDKVDVKVLSSEMTKPPHVIDAALGLRGRASWCLRRLASIDGEPLALLTAWLQPRYARGVSDRDLGAGSLYEALRQVHGVEMTTADNFVEVDRPGLEQAEMLGLAPGSPVLRVIGITRNQLDRPVEYSDVLYRPERFRFAIESRQPAGAD